MNIDLSALYGNDEMREMLKAKLSAKSISHAYGIAGPRGSGKKTLAFLLCAALCCEEETTRPCMRCPSCKKILSAQSPDFMTLGIEGVPPLLPDAKSIAALTDAPKKEAELPKSIGVDAIRAMQADAYIKPNDLERKLYIIGHAERMTVQAQNALLKILEEPPASVVFFLLTENPAALLTTVRSRIQMLKTEVFCDEQLQDYLLQEDTHAKALAKKDPAQFRLLLHLANGCIGNAKAYIKATAKELAADPVYEAHVTVTQCLACVFAKELPNDSPVLAKDTHLPRKTELLGILASRMETREQLRAGLDALLLALRDFTVCTLLLEDDSVPMLFFEDAAQPRALGETVSPNVLAEVSAELNVLRASLDANPNVGLVQERIAELLMKLRFGGI
ncbi:MAG: hypothetical protein J6I50_04620 [Clostridia bacterium]|nr:hypothetical protein [Clostridia bacterium]